jgi:hypothetical protein
MRKKKNNKDNSIVVDTAFVASCLCKFVNSGFLDIKWDIVNKQFAFLLKNDAPSFNIKFEPESVEDQEEEQWKIPDDWENQMRRDI